MSAQSDGFFRYGIGNFVYLGRTSKPDPAVGIFMKGGCDLMSIFVATPLMRKRLSGSCALFAQGIGISDARPDVLLQSRLELPEEILKDVLAPPGHNGEEEREDRSVSLSLDYFRPVLFEPTFTVPGWEKFGAFPKNLVALSIGPSVVRSVYRHRTHGYLVDPGGFWLNESMDRFLNNPDTARWFRDTFEPAGKMSLDQFNETFREVVRLVKQETGAPLLVLNTLVVDPSNPTHNYRFTSNNQVLRRRQFDLALRDMSRELDFYILDVDKALKLTNVSKQIDFAHFPVEYMKPIALEAYRILQELELV